MKPQKLLHKDRISGHEAACEGTKEQRKKLE